MGADILALALPCNHTMGGSACGDVSSSTAWKIELRNVIGLRAFLG